MEKIYVSFCGRQTTLCNCLPEQTNKNILTAMELSVSSWNEILHLVGGALETSKYAWYLIIWGVDSNDSPFMQFKQDELNITMYDVTNIQ